ncbi:hypothetical protein CXB51_020860 [Gossypium anomalum]|uniref:Protein NRT1/ PTR FAMILY 1.2-like n=1 Tax=Gossypium anomalum TaxID=47600 RepID=A0A8J5ZG52_9ROSI|nr:hypothetical protein CXB51_020860 [Gossypium anomalum]
METPSDENNKIREPFLSSSPSKGGFRTLPFILATEAFERVATLGLSPNMIVYLRREFGMETAKAANVIFFWSAATNFTPIIAIIPQARPYCDQFNTICEAPTTPQLLLLYFSLGLISIGAGGIRSSCMAFGADQLDKRNNPENTKTLQSFFGWYYATVTFSALIAVTLIVYVQDNLGWGMGFGIPVMLMFGSAVSFFLASSFYIKLKAKTSLLTGLAQVIVASFRNRHIELPSHATNEVYHIRKGSMLQVPSEKLRYHHNIITSSFLQPFSLSLALSITSSHNIFGESTYEVPLL